MAETAIQLSKPVSNPATLKTLLEKSQAAIAAILPKHLAPERVLKMALLATSRQPKLLTCTAESILKSVMEASELGLDFSGQSGKGFLVPFFNGKTKKMEAQFMPGFRGLLELAMRSGKVLDIDCQGVYAKDQFEIELGAEPKLRHVPAGGNRGMLIGCYAIGRIKDLAVPKIEWMARDQIEAIRKRSKAKSGPWETDFDEMARKTVIKRICKHLPSSVELDTLIDRDNEMYGVADNGIKTVVGVSVAEGVSQADALAAQITEQEPPQDIGSGECAGEAPDLTGDPDPDDVAALRKKVTDSMLMLDPVKFTKLETKHKKNRAELMASVKTARGPGLTTLLNDCQGLLDE